MPKLEVDVSERLTELFVLASAMYFKLALWHGQVESIAPEQLSLRDSLHENAIDLIRLSDHGPREISARLDQTTLGVRDLINGLDDLEAHRTAVTDHDSGFADLSLRLANAISNINRVEDK